MQGTTTRGAQRAPFSRRGRVLAAILMFAGLLVGTSAPIQALPSADEVLEASIKAMGGAAAFEALQNRVTQGTMSIPAMGITGTMTAYSAPPNLQYSMVETESMGSMESGTDGNVVWEKTAMTGPRIKSGPERAASLREAIFNSVLRWKELYASAEVVGEEQIEGRPCYKVMMTPLEGEGQIENHFYDKETHLLTKVSLTLSTEMGDVPIESFISDYREIDGIKLAFKTRQVVMGIQEMIFALESVEHNVDLPADRFALPPDIQALVAP
jgi:hypothetical protein